MSFKIMEHKVKIQNASEVFVVTPFSVLVFWKKVAQDDINLDCEVLC